MHMLMMQIQCMGVAVAQERVSVDLPHFYGQLEVLDLWVSFHQVGDDGFAVV
jgi:hypothetical protein